MLALSGFGQEAIPALAKVEDLLAHPNERVRSAAMNALRLTPPAIVYIYTP